MTNSKATKKALFMSMLSLLLCFTMLMGATFAWFTDTVTSTKNIIKSGNLDVEMYWADGDEDPTNATWQDASAGAIFDYQNWEPGYVQARHLKIKNVGSLALKYQLRILADGIVSKLANVIDVYYVETAKQLTRDNINNPQTPVVKLGTLSEVLNNTNANALTKTVVGKLEANKGIDSERTLTLAFKMQESAGNEYQNLSIGSEFRVELLATQVEAEVDSFDDTYDKEADFAPQETPSAMVKELSGNALKIKATGLSSEDQILDVGYQFEPTETYAQAQASPYRYYHADFVVSADEDIPADSLALAGYYKLFCNAVNDGKWVALTAPNVIKAGETVRLVEAMGGGSITVNYEELCNYGNDGTGFQCGVINLSKENVGKTITVELRLFETEEPSASNGNTHNKETGNSLSVGTFKYTIPGDVVTPATLSDAIANASATEKTLFVLSEGVYSDDITLTVAAQGEQKGGDIVFKAAEGANVVFTGTTTLGYRNQGVGSTMWNGNVTFEGITFDHANDATHSLDVQDVKSLTLKNCTIIGDGEFGITSARGNSTGHSKIIGCKFENAGAQLLGNFATGLVIDDCDFKNSCINVQAGNSVTVQNCRFDSTLTNANLGESFYLVRSNSTPITVKNCKVKVDSTVTGVAAAQAKWGMFWNRGTTNWTVSDVEITMTAAAEAQTELLVTKCTSTGVINTSNLTVNGVAQ